MGDNQGAAGMDIYSHRELMEMATEAIGDLTTNNDAQAQELQDARAKKAKLAEALGHTQAKVDALREVVGAIEWVPMVAGLDSCYCPWCESDFFDGHARDCKRQAALESTE